MPPLPRRPLLLLALAALTIPSLSPAAEPARLPRENLLVRRDPASATGATLPVRTLAEWQQRRAEIVRGMETVMGAYPGATSPKRVALDMRIEEQIDRGSYVIRRLTYQSEPGSRTPAFLCIPKAALSANATTAHAFPAILCLHPTDQTAGAGVVVGLGGKPNRQYASELAARGYVTLAPAYPHLANYSPDLKGLGYASGTMKAIWDNSRALDLLASLPFVKTSAGFGAIGHSLGGHNSLYTAVFEPRISVIVSSCGFDSYLDYYGGKPAVWAPGKGWCQERYLPRLLNYAGRLADIPYDFPEILGALAPRPLFINAPLRDSNFQWQSVDRCIAAAREVYTLHDASARLTVAHPDSEHDFPDAQRETAYRLFDSVLGR